jgi:hypothetical protein
VKIMIVKRTSWGRVAMRMRKGHRIVLCPFLQLLPKHWSSKTKKTFTKAYDTLGPWRSHAEQRLSRGHDAPPKSNISLDDFTKIITNPEIRPLIPRKTKRTPVDWNRGSLTTGDEAKMVEMQIDTYDKQADLTMLIDTEAR